MSRAEIVFVLLTDQRIMACVSPRRLADIDQISLNDGRMALAKDELRPRESQNHAWTSFEDDREKRATRAGTRARD